MKLATILVIITLLFGGSGLSIAAAQSTLPGEFLYPIKLFSEDTQLNLTASDENQVEFALKFANRRYEEIKQLLEDGLMPPDPVIVRWQNQLLTAMQKSLESEDQITQLNKVKDALQQQAQKMNQLQLSAETEPFMNQFKNQLKSQLGLVEAGINNPDKLGKELQWMFAYQQQQKGTEAANEWQHLFANQNQGEQSNFQYQWQYQYQTQLDGAGDSEQLNQNQNQENNQNNDPGDENSQNNNNDQEQNGNGGSNGSQNGSQNNGSGGNNGGGGGK